MSEVSAPGWGLSIYNFFRSIKLAIVLILFITLTSIISTFIPQKEAVEFYIELFKRPLAWLIITSGFDNFFKSFLFIAPSILFFANLSTCTFHRFKSRLVKKTKKRFGPDILHIGLLVMIVGGIITFTGRDEGYASMEVGDNISIPGGYVMTLINFEYLKYENGSPKDWISTVKVEKGDNVIHEAYPIEVNRPLKVGNVKLYQSSYDVDSYIMVTDPDGTAYRLSAGQMIPVGEDGYILRDVSKDKENPLNSIAHFDFWQGHEVVDHFDYSISEMIDIYTISSMESYMATGLQMVRDPGYYPILIGLLLLTLGLFITYIQKINDGKL